MQKDQLFRSEALEKRAGASMGTIHLRVPRLGWVYLTIGAIALALVSVGLVAGRYARHETMEGMLVPSAGIISVSSPSAGIAMTVMVKPGDQVSVGQPLFEIVGGVESTDLGDTRSVTLSQLNTKATTLRAGLADVPRRLKLQGEDLEARMGILREEIKAIQEQIATQRQRADGAEALYELWLSKSSTGVVSKLQMLQQKDVALQNLVALKQLQRDLAGNQGDLMDAQSELRRIGLDADASRRDLERQLTDVEQAILQAQLRKSTILKAQSAGTVSSVLIQQGQHMKPDDVLATILPKASPLVAELWAPPGSIGFIAPGDAVQIRYDAFPYERFGQRTGRVTDVDRSASGPVELKQLLGRDFQEPRYRILVSLDSQTVMAYGKAEALRPGMHLKADVLLGRTLLIEWVLDPLRGFSGDSHTGITGTAEAPASAD